MLGGLGSESPADGHLSFENVAFQEEACCVELRLLAAKPKAN